MTRQNEIRTDRTKGSSIPSLTHLFRAIFVMLFCFSLIQAIPLRIDTEKKSEGLISPTARMEIEKKAQCFQTEREMECYAIMRSVDVAYWQGTPSITTSTQPQRIEYLGEIYRFNKTYDVDVCLKYSDSICSEWGKQRITEQWAEFQPTPSAVLSKNSYTAVKLTYPKWSFSNTKENFAVQAGQISADPEVSTCGSTLTGAAGTEHWLTGNLNCTSHGLIFGADNIILDCKGYTIEYGRISVGVGINATNRRNVTIRNCVLLQQNTSVNGVNYGILLSNTNNSLIENISTRIVEATSESIMLISSNFNNISNVRAANNFDWRSHSINLNDNSHNNVLFNISSNATEYALYVGGNNNTINNATLIHLGTTRTAVFIAGNLNQFYNIYITSTGTHNGLFVFRGTTYHNIAENITIFDPFGTGGGLVFYDNAINNTIRNINITSFASTSVFIQYNAFNNTIENFNIRKNNTNNVILFEFYSATSPEQNNTFKNGVINETLWSVTRATIAFRGNTQGTLFDNVTIISTNTNQTFLGGTTAVSGGITFLDVFGFNQSRLTIFNNSVAFNLTEQWRVRVNVSWINGTPIQGALVNTTNEQGIFQNFGTTGTGGLTNWIVMNDTMFRGAVSNISYALTNFTANTTGAILNTTNFTIVNSTTFTIFLTPSELPPPPPPKYLNATHVSPNDGWTNTSSTTPIGVVLTCGASSNETLTSIGVKVWNSTNALVYQNVSFSQNNESSFSILLPNGTYNWQCNASSNTLTNETGNRTFTLIYQPPPKVLNASHVSPPNGWSNTSSTTPIGVVLTCGAISNETLTSIGVKVWNSTNVLVYQNVSLGENNESSFSILLPAGTYNWQCNATSNTLSNETGNRTFTLIYQPPPKVLNVSHVSPADGWTNTSNTTPIGVVLKCKATTNESLTTIGIKVWNSTNSLIYQTITSASGEQYEVEFPLMLSPDTYKWQCNATSTTLANASGNRTFNLQYIPPIKVLSVWQSYPANASVKTSPVTFNCSANVSYELLTTIGIRIWNASGKIYENVSIRSGNYNTSSFTVSLAFGNYSWECNASSETLNNNSIHNFTIMISSDSQPPLAILQYPQAMITIRSKNYPFSCVFRDNIEVDYGYFTIWDMNGTMVLNQTASIQKMEELNISTLNLNGLIGSYEWSCGACDWAGNCFENSSKRYLLIFLSQRQTSNAGGVSNICLFLPLLVPIIVIVLYIIINFNLFKKLDIK